MVVMGLEHARRSHVKCGQCCPKLVKWPLAWGFFWVGYTLGFSQDMIKVTANDSSPESMFYSLPPMERGRSPWL